MYINENEVAKLTNLHEAFIKSMLENDAVYYLKDGETLAIIEAAIFEGYEAMLFFSSFEQAEKFKNLNLPEFKIEKVSSKVFTENWLVGLLEMEVVLAMIWTDELNGKEMSPFDMMKDTVKYIQEKNVSSTIDVKEMINLINSL